MNNSPENIFAEYEKARRFKSSVGKRGIYEQNRINERFYSGDQWHGASVGNEKPLVRHNIIKRIGDYKIAQLFSTPLSVRYFAEGFSQNLNAAQTVARERAKISESKQTVFAPLKSDDEVGLTVSVLNSYRQTVAARVRLDTVLEEALRDAYIRGTGAVYTYFDPDIKTGLYADKLGGTQIMGDIMCQCVKIEDIYFADESEACLQKQPYIILCEERSTEAIAKEAERFGADSVAVERIRGSKEEKQTVFTKLFKARMNDGEERVFAVKTTKTEVIRGEFCLGVAMYPLAIFCWERRDGCIYGDSEVTYIIPNQIAINRMITASVWSAMSSGMPLMVVNGDLVSGDITNEPGQIIKVYGAAEDISSAVSFVTPPDFSAAYNESVNNLIANTLTQCGANEAALGDLEASNTSAIIELREAASKHLIPLKNRFFAFASEIALIWAEFFFAMYGKRCLKVSDENGIWYFPFDASRYKDLVLTVSVETSEGITRGERERLSVLKELFENGAISKAQYIKRLPSGMLAEADALAEEIEREEANERI